ncbi:membrane protein [Prevotella herbatica]|uniref:Membrane protein n=1 Tax=Prevotella herbatica TaxID=2801997 RepID=A0ABM7NZM1_9BACT|nr:LrgB family protein [Prevotella herbatica]BCS85971.1 membrane protein [Prevotella herbatica]
MKDLFQDSVYFGVLISLSSYILGIWIRKKTRLSYMNPLLIAIIITICVLLISGVSYKSYSSNSSWISYLLTPATICLAVPLYQQMELLKKNSKAILFGILSGVLSSLVSILLLALLFSFDHNTYVTFLPKSITTAIGMGISEELGGYVSISVVVIIITGVLGNIFAEGILKLLHIEEPIAKGIAIGCSSHAVGTARAMEMGAVEGAISGLSIVVCGILTVIGASIFALFL